MKIVSGGLGAFSSSGEDPEFKIVGEEIMHSRYMTFYDRGIQFPDGQVHQFDVVGHPRSNFRYCVTFPFHSAPTGRWLDGEVTIIREYSQGMGQLMYCLPTGSYDVHKHATLEDCAKAELSEEAHLKGGKLVKLLDDNCTQPENKYSRNSFAPFIAIDPEVDMNPGALDKEEFIQIVRVTIPELRKILRSGQMILPSVVTCWWAMEYLMDNDK